MNKNIKISGTLRKRWATMENENRHTELKLEIATHFKLARHIDYFSYLLKERERIGHLPCAEVERSYNEFVEMRKTIKEKYGIDINKAF
ncbi:MAG: hypothetical protein LUD72_12220 [Bacteroidales bacterium]|nr:hypothetical protein [Bacteroidales bacterium]